MSRFLHRPEDLRVLHAEYSGLLAEYYARPGLGLVRGHAYPSEVAMWAAQRLELRRLFLGSLGLEPDAELGPAAARGDLRARTTGVVDRACDGYRVELVEFQSRERFFVTGTLYLPERATPGANLPAVFCPHGHRQTGKHTRHIQTRCITLARRGFVTLVIDTIGHGEREFMDHRGPASHALLYAGSSLPGLQLWDNVRALDYLCARPEVDPARVGVTGESGGGNHTIYLAAVDERVAAAVPVCAVEMLDDYFAKTQCVCETVPDLLTYADKPHLLGLIAPRPLLIMNGMRDAGFPTLSARRAYDAAQQIYCLHPEGLERIAYYETNAEHSYDRPMRLRAYDWFDRWLGRPPHDPSERDEFPWVEGEEDETLRVWRADGAHPDGAHTLSTYYAQVAEALEPARFDDASEWRHRILTEALGGSLEWLDDSTPPTELIGTSTRSDCTIERLVYWSEDGVPVPALLFRPLLESNQSLPAVVYVSPAGKARAAELRAVHQAVRAGAIVLAIDYRGQGETAGTGPIEGELPAVERGIMLRRPLFGGRVYDLLRGTRYLASRPDVDGARVHVWGDGASALVALHAAALDVRIAGAACFGLPRSYTVHHGERAALDPWLVVPGLLCLADVNDLMTLVAPRPCVTGSTGDAASIVPSLVVGQGAVERPSLLEVPGAAQQ